MSEVVGRPVRRPRAGGKRLRFELDEALKNAAVEHGVDSLEWSEQELLTIERAANTADRADVLNRLWRKELAGDARPALLMKLSAELRACEKAIVDLVSRVDIGVGTAKSERHVRAANSRHHGRGEGA